MKRKGILTHARTWMDLEDTMLRETSQSQKDRHCTIPFTENARNSQSRRERGWGGAVATSIRGTGSGGGCSAGGGFRLRAAGRGAACTVGCAERVFFHLPRGAPFGRRVCGKHHGYKTKKVPPIPLRNSASEIRLLVQ